jgi:fructoselysine-6-P-deglycase FrlB-like protein
MLASGRDQLEKAVAEEMRAMGAEVIVSGEDGGEVNFDSALPGSISQILHLMFGQLLAYSHSMAAGLNPDLPENLNAVVIL